MRAKHSARILLTDSHKMDTAKNMETSSSIACRIICRKEKPIMTKADEPLTNAHNVSVVCSNDDLFVQQKRKQHYVCSSGFLFEASLNMGIYLDTRAVPRHRL